MFTGAILTQNGIFLKEGKIKVSGEHLEVVVKWKGDNLKQIINPTEQDGKALLGKKD